MKQSFGRQQKAQALACAVSVAGCPLLQACSTGRAPDGLPSLEEQARVAMERSRARAALRASSGQVVVAGGPPAGLPPVPAAKGVAAAPSGAIVATNAPVAASVPAPAPVIANAA